MTKPKVKFDDITNRMLELQGRDDLSENEQNELHDLQMTVSPSPLSGMPAKPTKTKSKNAD